MRKAIALLVCVGVLSGCASASSTMLSEDTAIISAESNGPGGGDKLVRDALAEAARVTRAHGYRYFVVLTADDLTHTVTVRIPGMPLYAQPPRANESFRGFVGRGFATGPPSIPMTPDRTEQRIKPAMDIMIRMHRQGEIEPKAEGVWDATAIVDGSSITLRSPTYLE
jgi:hypothetical protein